MQLTFGEHVLPGGRAYSVANRVAWLLGFCAAVLAYSLVPAWYIGIPLGLFAIWITTALSGLLWYQIRELLSCTERSHRLKAGVILAFAIPAGVFGFLVLPNWNDFEFNGHPSLVALAGSIVIGMLAFIYASGIINLLGLGISFVIRKFTKTF